MKRFKNILYVVEEAATDQDAAIARAVAMARDNQAKLTALYVAEKPRLGPFADRFSPAEFEARLRQREMTRIEALFAAHRGSIPLSVEVRFGIGVVEVVRDVLRNDRDLVIKVTGDGGIHAFLFGGTDQHLLRKCPCPVWLMQPGEKPKYARIMAAVDFDPWLEADENTGLNRLILELASSMVLTDFAELHLAHAWQPIAENVIRVFGSDLPEQKVAANLESERRDHQARLEGLANDLRGWVGTEAYRYVAPQLHLRQGKARHVIPELAKEMNADLVVMGTVSRTGIPGFIIGNTAEVILNNIECAVLAVKPRGFESPVQLDE